MYVQCLNAVSDLSWLVSSLYFACFFLLHYFCITLQNSMVVYPFKIKLMVLILPARIHGAIGLTFF